MEQKKKGVGVNELLLTVTVTCFFIFLIHNVSADTVVSQANIGNSAPVASSTTIAAGNLQSDDIFLTANRTTQINITTTITDNNGCTDVTAVNATFYRTNMTGGSSATDDNRTHYSMECTVQSGTCTGDSDLAATYECHVNVTWYLDPTDAGSLNEETNWSVNVTPYDGDGAGTSDRIEHDVDTLTAFSLLDSTINFGSLSLGQNTTTTNQNVTILNTGNEGLDFNFTGYGVSTGDNYSMNCTLGTIPIDNLEYNHSTFDYGNGFKLSNASTELDLDIDRGSNSTERPTKPTFYGFEIPSSGVGGSCSGTVTIVARSDPTLD